MLEPPTEQLQLLDAEVLRTLNDLKEAKTTEQRRDLSEIVKNLATAHGVYLNWLSSMASMLGEAEWEEDDEWDEEGYEDDEVGDPLDFPPRPHR